MSFPIFPRVLTWLSVLSFLFIGSIRAQEATAVWSGDFGNWDEARYWSNSPNFPNNNGFQLYSAVLDGGVVTLNRNITIEQLILGMAGVPTLQGNNGGKVARATTLNVRSNLRLNQGLITGKSTLNALGRATISGDSNLYGWAVTLSGRTLWSGRLGVGNASVIHNLRGATIDLSNGAVCTFYSPFYSPPDGQKRTLNNYGTINANSSGTASLDIVLNNRGTINVGSGSLILADGGEMSGAINLANGATLDFESTNSPSGPGTSGPSYLFTGTSSIAGIGSVKFNSWSNYPVIGGIYDISGTTTVSGGTVSFISPITSLGNSLVVNGDYAICDLGSNSVTVATLTLRRGTITGSGTVTVNGPLEWAEGSIGGEGATNAKGGVFFNGLDGGQFNTLDRTLNCYGYSHVETTAAYYGNLNFGLNGALNIMPGATFNGSRLAIAGSSTSGRMNGLVTNYGTLVVDNPGVNRGMAVIGTAFVNQGAIQITNSTLHLSRTDDLPALTQNAGSVQLQNGTLACKSIINGGSLNGYGTVSEIVNSGRITPSGGILNFLNNSLTLQANSVLAYELNGTQPGISFGQISGVSIATLGGTLQITLSETFRSRVQSSDVFALLAAQTVTGQFTNIPSGARLRTADGSGSFLVTYNGNVGPQVTLSEFLPSTARGDFDWSGNLASPAR